MIKLTSQQQRHSLKLLHMCYSIPELSKILTIDPSMIIQACAEDCPHLVEKDMTWIVGTAFQKWAGIDQIGTHVSDLILRENWLDVESFLQYNERALQRDLQTVKRKRTHLRHLLEWAADKPLSKAADYYPTFPAYMLTVRNDGRAGILSAETLDAGCEETRRFFVWALGERPARYGSITKGWIDTIRPARANGRQSVITTHEFYTIEDMLTLAALEPHDLTEQRDRAAACFLFLSGMRVGAFASLPIDCVDLKANKIMQLPSKGVRTKNHKAAITHLLQIPMLLRVVQEWDDLIRSTMPGNTLWFALLDTRKHLTSTENAGFYRSMFVTKGLKKLCSRANIPFRSPHKLRHGHTVYALMHAKTMMELKAVSQNLMHSSITITDGIYGNLTTKDVNATIANLGKTQALPANDMAIFLRVLANLQKDPAIFQSILDA